MLIISLLITVVIGHPLYKRDENSQYIVVGVLCICASLLVGALLSYFCNSFTKSFKSSALKRSKRKNSKDYHQRHQFIKESKKKSLDVITEEPEELPVPEPVMLPPPYTERILVSTENQRKIQVNTAKQTLDSKSFKAVNQPKAVNPGKPKARRPSISSKYVPSNSNLSSESGHQSELFQPQTTDRLVLSKTPSYF
ncbi:hypothetical protein HK103_000702 [Boothiomyces macroporosus]|uniref:Uncharacterized protein n=1 Tax=Boothiomyces macroporosus TaxID=261099 RepID=A0AAD5UFI3_9FUNG|nr:hypothetical protein HK103_000702 [Boothiomyces macroporosus]